ncbi:MAG: hypothetical protein ABSD52_12655 [Candidatus Cybelea sp.]|jgi:hypothetical protein
MRLLRFLWPVLAAVVASPAGSSAAASDPLATWFGSQTCPALDGLYSRREPPYVKTGMETLVLDVPTAVLWKQKVSMTVPWYVYDPKTNVALSHVGGDSGVVWTLRVVKGAPPTSLPRIDLSDAHTTSGLKIGASAESVVRTLGKPLVIHACGMERYEYSDDKDPHAEQNDLDFTIRNGRVIEIAHTSWG